MYFGLCGCEKSKYCDSHAKHHNRRFKNRRKQKLRKPNQGSKLQKIKKYKFQESLL